MHHSVTLWSSPTMLSVNKSSTAYSCNVGQSDDCQVRGGQQHQIPEFEMENLPVHVIHVIPVCVASVTCCLRLRVQAI